MKQAKHILNFALSMSIAMAALLGCAEESSNPNAGPVSPFATTKPPKDTTSREPADVKDSSDVEDITSSSSSSPKSSSSSDTKGSSSGGTDSSESSSSAHKAVDYSKGRAMNKRISKGINLGNAWDSACYSDWRESGTPYNYGNKDGLDACWQNPIKDEFFQIIKDAGFNSVRIPVRWQHNSNPETHQVNPERLAGVMEDVQLAIDAGLAAVISFHHYNEMMNAANGEDSVAYEAELFHFTSIWTQVAEAFEVFPDNMIIYDILNEPSMKSAERLNEVMTAGYKAIRKAAPGKTIMFESYHAAKFADITALELPEDGNIIYSGHYYEPFSFTHQGHAYSCKGDDAYSNNASRDFRFYVMDIKKLYPDVNGGHVPVNIGEFGASGGGDFANAIACKTGTTPPSAAAKAKWVNKVIEAAEENGISWIHWGFAGLGGFEVYDKSNNEWYEGFPEAFGL